MYAVLLGALFDGVLLDYQYAPPKILMKTEENHTTIFIDVDTTKLKVEAAKFNKAPEFDLFCFFESLSQHD